jgi:hypothetical protein
MIYLVKFPDFTIDYLKFGKLKRNLNLGDHPMI